MNRTVVFSIFVFFAGFQLKAQLNGFSLLEYQSGSIPEENSNNYTTLFSKVHLNYISNKLYVYGRFESFHSPIDSRDYNKITKYGAEYSDKGLMIKIGTLNETLARGVLLRSYEIPSAMIEDKGFRVRQSFNRDILGVSGKYSSKNFSLGVLRGSPLFNLLPPTFSDSERRPDLLEAVHASFSKFGQNFEIGWMRTIDIENTLNYPWINFNGRLLKNYSYAVVYTQQTSPVISYSQPEESASYGIYGNLSANFDRLSINLELKSYNNLIVGSGFNEPPALIKEHSSRLLNRSSHVLLPQNEKGYQFDIFYSFSNDSRLNFNHSLAINNFASSYRYSSFYLEYYQSYEAVSYKLFADYTNDQFKQEKNRFTAGGTFDFNTSNFNGELQIEQQLFNRNSTTVSNSVISVELGNASKYSVGSTLELSNDPFQLTDEDTRTWLGFYGRYKYSANSNFLVFAGQRRGGPACTAGICYEVLDFEGVEIRWNTRF